MCGGLPFGYKAANGQKDLESFEVVGGRQKLWDGGDGEVQRRRSQGQGEWVLDGLCRVGWGFEEDRRCK